VEPWDEWAAKWSAAHPDGCAIDSRDLPGYHPPTPLRTGESEPGPRNAQGQTLNDIERELCQRPGSR
jgi:hypothetical protein